MTTDLYVVSALGAVTTALMFGGGWLLARFAAGPDDDSLNGGQPPR